MREGPIYIYDLREQFQEPVAVVYRKTHAAPVVEALGFNMGDMYVSLTRLHPHEGNRYTEMGSCEKLKVRATKSNVIIRR